MEDGVEANDIIFGYNGEEYTEATGLQYLRARHYDPQTGTFTSQDTYSGSLQNPNSQNRYTYAENDPVNGNDPGGDKKKSKKNSIKKAAKAVKKVAKKASKSVKKTSKKSTPKKTTASKKKALKKTAETIKEKAKRLKKTITCKAGKALDAIKSKEKQAFNLRNQYRAQARELMSDRQKANFLYKNEPNLKWEEIVKIQEKKGLKGDEIYKEIIESSQRSRTSVNEKLGVK